MTQELLVTKEWYNKLNGVIDEEILTLKNIENDFLWDLLNKQSFNYIYKYCQDSPLANHFSLAVLCATDRKLSPASINNMLASLNVRFRDIFNAFKLAEAAELNYSHIHDYLFGAICEEHTDTQRKAFISYYKSLLFNVLKWTKSRIPMDKQNHFSKFFFPEFPFDNRDYSFRNRAINSAQKKRKDESSAVAPLLPSIRAQCHIRWNQIKRLREITNKAIAKVEDENLPLPYSFNYEESEYLNECLYFELNRVNQGEYFLEFVKSIDLSDGAPGEGLWFFELLKNRLLGAWSNQASTERLKEGVEFLENWGHDTQENRHPFQSRNSGVLTQGFSLTKSQNLNKSKLFINVEPLYIACMFAVFALDIQSFSGARMNEILQVSHDSDCCVIIEDKKQSPPKKKLYISFNTKRKRY
ncbi:hypothetical protein IAQ67_12670 [Paenibacillus peoriae]|uniref:Uncharacterized protein n=1 Tax=Paenibacillus peoriae TaxID=59893 RepID=A0A7H0YFC2_9BACL|nr:hypothetical protein [Paenibacillus peoriae]QNR69780.1 hypothetical protein IAQ67_12670 [Paenibacillus peoriae]